MTRVLVTGASGFVGRALVAQLAASGQKVRAAMRRPADIFPRSVEVVAVSDLTRRVDWEALLKQVDAVVHLAGIAHVEPGIAEDLYDRVNRLATSELASIAKACGVRRLVFVSSIRAQNGPASDTMLRESDPPRPTDAYGRSKLAAEEAVRNSGVPHTILRPVLIYGSGARGNFARLLKICHSHWPLPFGSFHNRRSLLALENLISAIRLSMISATTLGETFIVSDRTSVSIADIVTALRAGEGRRPHLVSIPVAPLSAIFRTLGYGETWDRLGGSLEAEPTKLLQAGWAPTIETLHGLRNCRLGLDSFTPDRDPAH